MRLLEPAGGNVIEPDEPAAPCEQEGGRPADPGPGAVFWANFCRASFGAACRAVAAHAMERTSKGPMIFVIRVMGASCIIVRD